MLPHIDDAHPVHYDYMSKQNILEAAVRAYGKAENADKFERALKMVLDNAHNANTADGARLRLATFLDRQGRYAEALDYLKQIGEKNGVEGARAMIPDIEKKLKNKEGR